MTDNLLLAIMPLNFITLRCDARDFTRLKRKIILIHIVRLRRKD